MQKRTWLVVTSAVFVAFSFRGMPLTYDETWNYNETAALGLLYTLTHYNFNNHVLYAALMSVIPRSLVTLEPFLMRIPNWLAGLGLFTLIYRCFEIALHDRNPNGARTRALQLVLATGAVFASAPLTYYYLVGRGYLLGCTLALAAIYFRQPRFRAWISDALLALSGYAVLTYYYIWPGILVVDLIEEGVSRGALTRLFRRWFRSTLLLFLLYATSLTRMRAESRDYQAFEALWSFTRKLLGITYDWPSLSPYLAAGAIALGPCTYLIARARVPAEGRADQPAALLAAYFSSAMLSFLVVAEVTNGLHIVQTPYVRNGMFLSLYGIMAIGLSATVWLRPESFTFVRAAALLPLAIVAVNGVATASAMFPPLLAGKYLRFPVSNTDCPVPISNRFLKSLPKGAELFCGGYAGSVCWPFRPAMARFGLTYLPGGDDAFDREPRIRDCWSGTEAGDRSCSLYVRRRPGDPFQPLCY